MQNGNAQPAAPFPIQHSAFIIPHFPMTHLCVAIFVKDLDIELETFRRTGKLQTEPVTPRDQRAGVIASAHDFVTRPAKLSTLLTDLNTAPADVAKVVWTARSVRDNLEAFEILLHRQKPTIALCMGESG